jgi:hypothetical protein
MGDQVDSGAVRERDDEAKAMGDEEKPKRDPSERLRSRIGRRAEALERISRDSTRRCTQIMTLALTIDSSCEGVRSG